MKFLLLIIILSLYLSVNCSSVIESLESAYQTNTLAPDSPNLLPNNMDTDSERAAKNYYRAVLSTDFQNSLLTHTTNFSSHPNEYYGQLSGIQLISIDFINHEHEKALLKLDRIDNTIFPETQYWRAKIFFALERYDEAIQVGQTFINNHAGHRLFPQVWLVVLESIFRKKDLSMYERNLEIFARSSVFQEYRPYLLFLQGQLCETPDIQKARNIYTRVIAEYPASQFRVQAEDRLLALRSNATLTPPPTPDTPFKNKVVRRYEELDKGRYYIQFGVFEAEQRAKNYVNALNRDKIPTFHITKPISGKRLFAVIQGPYPTMTSAIDGQGRFDQRRHQSFVFMAE